MALAELKAKNAVESLRDVVQDLLVPELKAIKSELESIRRENRSELDSLHTEVRSGDEATRNELRAGYEALRNELRAGDEAIRTELRLRDEKQAQAIEALSDKVGYMLHVRERLAVLEDRAKRE